MVSASRAARNRRTVANVIALGQGGGGESLANRHLLGLRAETPALLDNAKTSLGVTPELVHAFPHTPGDTWAQLPGHIDTTLANWAGRTDIALEWAMPLATTSQPLGGLASGAYDAILTQVFQKISAGVPAAQKTIVCRPGWEMTLQSGPGAEWNVTKAAGLGALFIADWRKFVTLTRAVDPRFRFSFCLTNTQTDYTGAVYDPFDPSTGCFPGVAYVDHIGQDSYHQTNEFTASVNGSNLFDTRKNLEVNSLDVNYAKAVALGLPFCLPEWGVANDDPETIRQYFVWMRGKNIAYAMYWDKNAGTTFICQLSARLSDGVVQYPNAKAEFTRQASAPTFVTPAAIPVPAGDFTADIHVSKGGCTLAIVGAANGLALSGNVLFGNLANGQSASVTLRVTDERGLFSDRTFTLTAATANYQPEVSIANLRATTAPSAALQALQSELVAAIKASGYWSKIDELLLPLNDNQQAGYINMKSPRHDGTISGTPLFRYRGGARGDGSAARVDTGIVPNSIGRNFGKNAGFFAALFLSDLPNGGSAALEIVAGAGLFLQRGATGVVSGRILTGSDITIGPAKTLPAFVGLALDAPGSGRSFVDGVATAWSAAASRFAYDTLKIHGAAGTGFGVNDIGLVIVGAPPTSAEMAALNAAVQAYKAGVMTLRELSADRAAFITADRRDTLSIGGDSVLGITDPVSGKVYAQATSANQAKWLGSGFGTGPAFVFDGSDILPCADALTISGAPDLEIWSLVQNTETPGGTLRAFFQYGGGGFDSQIRCSRRAADGFLQMAVGRGSSQVLTCAGPADSGTAKAVFRGIIKPTYAQVEVDGVLGQQQVGVPAITAGPANIGALSGPSSGWIGNMRVPVIVLLNPTAAKSDLIRNYLTALK